MQKLKHVLSYLCVIAKCNKWQNLTDYFLSADIEFWTMQIRRHWSEIQMHYLSTLMISTGKYSNGLIFIWLKNENQQNDLFWCRCIYWIDLIYRICFDDKKTIIILPYPRPFHVPTNVTKIHIHIVAFSYWINVNSTNVSEWWCHQIETFRALLDHYAGNSPVIGEFPSQRTVTQGFDVFFDQRLKKRFSEQSRRQWFGTPSFLLSRHCNS